MAMGEGLGRQSTPSPHHYNPGKAFAGSQLQWAAAAILQGERLAEIGQAEPELLPDFWIGKSTDGLSVGDLSAGNLSAGEIAIATLPIALFYHDNLTQQRHYLKATVAAWGGDERTSDAVIVFGYAIAQAVKEQLTPSRFIAQILTYLHVSLPESAVRSIGLIRGLESLKQLVADDSELHNVIAALELDSQTKPISIEIAIALYCFLQTPNVISLTLIRAVRLGIKPAIVGALAGALAGAYTGEVGIPAAWRSALQASSTAFEFSQRVQRLSAQLVLAWSGVYDPSVLQEKDCPLVTVPWIVRS